MRGRLVALGIRAQNGLILSNLAIRQEIAVF